MKENNYIEYHKSITEELLAGRNRVRYFIGGNHWGEDGRFKEVLLMNYLRRVLPSNVSIGTGFVKNKNQITRQIDIIIYDNSVPMLFSEGDFVITLPESVLGIIEVKSKLKLDSSLKTAIIKADENGAIIDKDIFNGIFGYESNVDFFDEIAFKINIKSPLELTKGFLNHISFGPDFFTKYWPNGKSEEDNKVNFFSFYKLENLSFGYFVSNLVEHINCKIMKKSLSEDLENFLYPIEKGKESYILKELEIKLKEPI